MEEDDDGDDGELATTADQAADFDPFQEPVSESAMSTLVSRFQGCADLRCRIRCSMTVEADWGHEPWPMDAGGARALLDR